MKVDKIIFLDIDGVLNSQELAEKHYKMLKAGTVPDGVNDLCDPEATDRLIKALDGTGAKIVLSSSWRSNTIKDTIEDFKTFRHVPFHKLVPYIIGITPRFKERMWRGKEIQYWIDWLRTGKLEQAHLILPDIEVSSNAKGVVVDDVDVKSDFRYVIVDDDSDMLKGQNFVQTDWTTGLTDENVEQIKKYLK